MKGFPLQEREAAEVAQDALDRQSWMVERHSGRDNTDWRVRCKTPDSEKARTEFDKIKEDLRQGGVRLRSPSGDIINSTWAANAMVTARNRS